MNPKGCCTALLHRDFHLQTCQHTSTHDLRLEEGNVERLVAKSSVASLPSLQRHGAESAARNLAMTAPRRFGTESSKTRGALLEAAEALMREEGYAGVTARRIASKAELKFQLVHYYFRTIDELFLALLKKIAQRNQARLEGAVESARPLRAIWEIIRDPDDQLLRSEFIALANHRKAIRAEIAVYDERLRSVQIQLLSQALDRRKVDLGAIPTVVLSVLMASIAQYVAAESSIGVSIGHAETLRLVEHYLQTLEPSDQALSRTIEAEISTSEPIATL